MYIYIYIYIYTSSQQLILTPGFLPPGYSSLSGVFSTFSPTWGDPAVGGGDISLGSSYVYIYIYIHVYT